MMVPDAPQQFAVSDLRLKSMLKKMKNSSSMQSLGDALTVRAMMATPITMICSKNTHA